MSRGEITMRSGAIVTFDTSELKVAKTPGLGLQSITWKTPDGAVRSLMHVDLDQVAAVVFIEAAS